ncbi:MAG: hypothetical protein EOP84_20630 [Verrucomicrobiaceae bacterium]|nr:MAG: hypothetical protein EOP84_20630 [Verrucomicrobiaceae bacterium]
MRTTTRAIFCLMILGSSQATAQQTEPDPFAELNWSLASLSYVIASACARKRFAFSSGDVETLKRIAIEKAKGLDPEQVNEDWNRMLTSGVPLGSITAAECFDAFEKADFIGGNNLFGF